MDSENKLCHVQFAIAIIGGKWKPWILWHLYECPRTYGDLRRLTPNITGKMLTQHLRELERDGIVRRQVFGGQKIQKVEYSFTEYGESLRPILKDLCEWGFKHLSRSQPPSAAEPLAGPALNFPSQKTEHPSQT